MTTRLVLLHKGGIARCALCLLLTACVSHADPDYTIPPCEPGDTWTQTFACREDLSPLCAGNESATFTCSDAGAWQLTEIVKSQASHLTP
jgi:hypothetical protein